MMKQAIATLLCCLSIFSSIAATNITTSSVSGHWTAAGAPYYIYNTINIDSGNTLIIDAGVSVVFKGPYAILVWGSLQANGSNIVPISFDVQDTTGWYTSSTFNGAWKGIYFAPYTGTGDVSVLRYCDLSYCKYSGVYSERSLNVEHCNFSNNKGKCLAMVYNANTGSGEVSNCKFYNNHPEADATLFLAGYNAEYYVHDNEFYNNDSYVVRADATTVLFSRNSVHNNTGTSQLLCFRSMANEPCNVVMNENMVYENKSSTGAVVYCNYITADIYRNYFCNNYHLVSQNCALVDGGGALYLMGNGDHNDSGPGAGAPSVYTVRNNIIANNYSALYGGGIGVYNAKILIANNTIVNNKAPRGGGIDLFMLGDVTTCIRNNILWGNVNESNLGGTGNVYLTSQSSAHLKYDHNWTAFRYSDDVSKMIMPSASVSILGDTVSNIIGTSAGMVSPTLTSSYTENAMTADFSLSAGSACIDNGISNAVVNSSADYAGNNRIYGNATDIGAFEYNAAAITAGAAIPVDTMFGNCCAVIAPATGIAPAIANNTSMNICPNPAINIMFINTATATGSIDITDAMGRLMTRRYINGTATAFDIHTWPRGTYYATWHNGDANITKKIIAE